MKMEKNVQKNLGQLVEQLTIDFSAKNVKSNDAPSSSSNVLSLENAQKVKLENKMKSVYRGINDSVKHIKLRF